MTVGLDRIKNLVNRYAEVLSNTQSYREKWKTETKQFIRSVFESVIKNAGLNARIIERGQIENLESIVLDLGRSSSGLSESLEHTDLKHTMVKNNGSLIYQQLFNGKIMVMLLSPNIEGYGEAKPPVSLEIICPDEATEDLILNHIERMLHDIVEWEDYDDDDKGKKVAFQPIGFQHNVTNGQ